MYVVCNVYTSDTIFIYTGWGEKFVLFYREKLFMFYSCAFLDFKVRQM